MLCATIGYVRIAVDSSTLISLAWAGQLELLRHAPVTLVVPHEVYQETVTEGVARGYPDAAAIEQAIKLTHHPAAGARASKAELDTVDHAVLEAGRTHGALLTNDLALGRRAANLGVRWLRTADFVLLCVRTGKVDSGRGVAALKALRSAGRITDELLEAYLKELP
jgi:predicted nucleic acid-binding protein